MALIIISRRARKLKFELKKNLIKHELGDLARLIEGQENDITLMDLSYSEHLEAT